MSRFSSSWPRRARAPGFLVGAGGQPALDLGEPRRETGSPFVDRGAANLELLAQLGRRAPGPARPRRGLRAELGDRDRFRGARFVERSFGRAQRPTRFGRRGIAILRRDELLEPAGQQRVPLVERRGADVDRRAGARPRAG